ncbi:putative protein FAM172B [Artibeus jamaicensis]|uniref:putative protein FAM172B n=1 Tax=Artibeus jamaicensis TaxID=9417 RepID=UPI00235AF665|nr:putative protein FAM172B [Artibeus jamaicensis]
MVLPPKWKINCRKWLPITQELSFQKFIEQSDLLEELKYDFNEKAELRHLETQRPFIYNYYKNVPERNCKRYQALSHLLEKYIYELLEKVCKLQKVYIPPEAEKEPRSFFFMSERALTNHHSALLVLLQDHGVFRAGQWSQQAIIHHGLQHGSQIPCIQMALQAHYDVIVLNPNDNFVDLKMEKEWKGLLTQNIESSSLKMVQTERFLSLRYIPKRCSRTPEEHMAYIWDSFISKTEGKDVAFIVHGYGGLVFMDLLVHRKWEVMSKVYAVALIDSQHHVGHQLGSDVQLLAWIKHHCREWVTSPKPLDKPATTVLKKEFPMVSAGTEKHDLALSSSLQSIFKYFKRALKAKTTINFSPVPKSCLQRSTSSYPPSGPTAPLSRQECKPLSCDVIRPRRPERAGFPAVVNARIVGLRRFPQESVVVLWIRLAVVFEGLHLTAESYVLSGWSHSLCSPGMGVCCRLAVYVLKWKKARDVLRLSLCIQKPRS